MSNSWGFILAAMVLAACHFGGQALANLPREEFVAMSLLNSGKPGDYLVELNAGGIVRLAKLHIPATYSDGDLVPLVLSLHGAGRSALHQESVSEMTAKADEAGFIVVYPEAMDLVWQFGPSATGDSDKAFLLGIVDLLIEKEMVDPQRVFITGFSRGAIMSNLMACLYPEVFAAAAPVAGGYLDCVASQPVAIIAFHGTEDALIPYEGREGEFMPTHDWAAAWGANNGCDTAPSVILDEGEVLSEQWGHCQVNADVVLYTIKGKGHSWPGSNMPAAITTNQIDATDLIWDFFAAHPK